MVYSNLEHLIIDNYICPMCRGFVTLPFNLENKSVTFEFNTKDLNRIIIQTNLITNSSRYFSFGKSEFGDSPISNHTMGLNIGCSGSSSSRYIREYEAFIKFEWDNQIKNLISINKQQELFKLEELKKFLIINHFEKTSKLECFKTGETISIPYEGIVGVSYDIELIMKKLEHFLMLM